MRGNAVSCRGRALTHRPLQEEDFRTTYERLDIVFSADGTHDIDRGAVDAIVTLLRDPKFWKKGRLLAKAKPKHLMASLDA